MDNMENMENTQSMPKEDNGAPRRPNPRRKKRKSWKRMVRAYLPLAAVVLVIILFIIFAVGSVNRANKKREEARQESLAIESSIAQQQLEWEAEANALIVESEQYAISCEFDKAIEVLDRFSGNISDFPNLLSVRESYENGDANLVSWEDPTTIPFLSFGKFVVDPMIGFSGDSGSSNHYLYISCAEFTAILQQLYDNDFMLVDMDDIFTTTKAEDGSALIVKNDLRLPAGKKPIVLIQCQSSGFDNPLVVNEDGSFTTKITPDEGESYFGAYDFVPLLEDFIATHPGFSLKGARAILALTGYKGLFGYPLEESETIANVATALKEAGYTMASNTYGNVAYNNIDLTAMDDDLASWEATALPLVGETEILAYARAGDISDGKGAYTSKKYEYAYSYGYKYYMGMCYNSTPWMSITDNTIRMGRIMVTGGNLKDSPKMFSNLFDASKVYGAK